MSIEDSEFYDESITGDDLSDPGISCDVCGLPDFGSMLLFCNGIIGRDIGGEIIRCNIAVHPDCMPASMNGLPTRAWYCRYCRSSVNRRTGYNLRPRPYAAEQRMMQDASENGTFSGERKYDHISCVTND